MRLSTRVARLATKAQTAGPGCATCGTWAPQVFLREGEEPRPERCQHCGRVVPIRLIRVYKVIESHPEGALPDGTAVMSSVELDNRAQPCEPVAT